MVLLAATLTINLISAYIRLDEAGMGCVPWPGCYAQVGRHLTEAPSASDTLAPVDTIKRAHRSVATFLVILVLLIVALARRQRLGRLAQILPYAVAGVVLLLAVVGPASHLKTLPAVATANLLGGMTLLALTWILWLETGQRRAVGLPTLAVAARVGLAVLIGQLLLGAWVSANFAAAACTALLTCAADGAGLESFWYLRELSLDESGRVVQDGSQALIQRVHHVWAIVTTITLFWLGVRGVCLPGPSRPWGAALLLLLSTQLLLGWSGLMRPPPLWMALSHNVVASLLLLVVLRLIALSHVPRVKRLT